MKLILLYFILILSFQEIFAQQSTLLNNHIPNSIPLNKLDINQATWCISSLTDFENDNISLTLYPSQFGISSLNYASLQYLTKFSIFSLSPIITATGDENYSEYLVALKSSVQISDKFRLGGSLNLGYNNIKNYQSNSIVYFDLGGLFKISNDINAGFTLTNLNGASFKNSDKNVYQTAIFGIGLKVLENLNLALNTVILLNHTSGISILANYNYDNDLAFKLAFLSNPTKFELSLDKRFFEKYLIALGVNYHNYLGYSPHLRLQYGF